MISPSGLILKAECGQNDPSLAALITTHLFEQEVDQVKV